MPTLFDVDSAQAFRQTLASLDTEVLPRTAGRTTDQTERYSIACLLSSLPHGRLAFPLLVEHCDRPDMVLHFKGRRTGVEITEAVPTNAARASAIRQSGVGPAATLLSRSTPNEARRTRAELIKEIEEDAGGPPWVGDAPEREWADAMAHVSSRKITSSRKSGFRRYDQNWLLIYDNWPLPEVWLSDAASILIEACRDLGLFTAFDSLFVLSRGSLCEFTTGGFSIYPVGAASV